MYEEIETDGLLTELFKAIDHETDDKRAVEVLTEALYADPMATLFAIWDAENAEAQQNVDAQNVDVHEIERLFATYDKRKQARRRKWPRDWQPYCLVKRADGTWTMVGREYKGLGSPQDHSAGWCDWNAAGHIVWQFKCGDPLLLPGGEGKDRIWRMAPGYWGPGRLYLPSNEPDYCACVGRLLVATINPSFYAALVLGQLPPAASALAA